jgi:hypothetical protein
VLVRQFRVFRVIKNSYFIRVQYIVDFTQPFLLCSFSIRVHLDGLILLGIGVKNAAFIEIS